MAAERLLQCGYAVTIYDAMPSPARKFLMAGRGGLNITHSEPLEKFLSRFRDIPIQLEQSIRLFDPSALRKWADALGANTFAGSSGRVFPKAMKASPLLRAWLRRLSDNGARLQTNHKLIDISANGALRFQTPEQEMQLRPAATILAMGGASWPRLGSTGTWRDMLLANGVHVAPFKPSNMGFRVAWTKIFADRFAGVPLKNIEIHFLNEKIRGEIVITRDGLEGGALYALSAPVRKRITDDGTAAITIDLKPDWPLDALTQKLRTPRRARETVTHFLARAASLPPPAIGLLRESLRNQLPGAETELAHAIKALPLVFTGTQGLERAISSAGGIAFDAIDAHFMLKKMPGVFAAGEMLDWEAPTGGYLLQATFATAVAAADGVCNYLTMKQ